VNNTSCNLYVHKLKDEYVISEKDFYPPEDNRVFKSYIEDIADGDNFADYSKYIFKLYEQEEWYE